MATTTEPEFDTLDPQVMKHLREMSIASVHEYRQWCFDHGFSRGLNKHVSARAEELRARRAKADAEHKRRMQEARQPVAILLACAAGELSSDAVMQPTLRFCARRIEAAAAATTEALDRGQFHSFLGQLASVRAKFLTSATESIQLAEANAHWIDGLLNVCQHRAQWLRPLESWRPRGHNARRQFSSLLRHLFCKYDDVPVFMDSAWLSSVPNGAEYRRWFIHLGQGKNLRHCQLPLNYTKRMAHFFMRAPNHLTIPQALRYGHVRGLGGDERTALIVIATRLGSELEHHEFWESVLRWFIEHPMLDRAQVGPIVDYIHYQKFGTDEVVMAPELATDSDPGASRQPNFSMRGRTPASLLRQVHRWHDSLTNDNRIQLREWLPIGVKTFDFMEGQDETQQYQLNPSKSFKHWSIRELLSTQALITEGRQLGHCVASYAYSCGRRQSSIWTMEMANGSERTKLLTIEIHPPTRTIVQVRGKANRLAKESEIKILQRWATQENLRIGMIV